jgi:hypothetical protein
MAARASEFTWVKAPLGSTSPWKKLRTMLAPRIDRDSCRAMPLAWPVHRSIRLVMSCAMLEADMPL